MTQLNIPDGVDIAVLVEYFFTGMVERMPTWVLSMSLLLASLILFMAGVVLDTVVRGQREARHARYLAVRPGRGERVTGLPVLHDRRDATTQAAPVERKATS